jgi:hypothetical protein
MDHVRGFHGLQTYFPTLGKLFRITKHQSKQIWLDSKYRIVGLDISGTFGGCDVYLVENKDASGSESPGIQRPAFLKVTHLLDPIRWMKGEYSIPQQAGLPGHSKTWASAWTKLQDQSNQAYVETIAAYALGKIRDAGVSPHFNEFYGAFCANADKYHYNLTEEFQSFRHTRWFWHGQNRGLYKLHVTDSKDKSKEVPVNILDDILREPSELRSVSDSYQEEELGVESIHDEEASLHSDKMSDISFTDAAAIQEEDEDEEEDEEEGSSGSSTEESFIEDNYSIYSEISKFPVMMIALERNDGTMDTLLDDYSLVGATPGTELWELHWSAWVFQVLAALSVAQAMLGFTHNDLHTNNIVWTATEEEFLYYTKQSGEVFKVPTYGKLFRVIDFGRAIFKINDQLFFSDDFKAGNDADGQYCFKPLSTRVTTEVPPNPSFDLCRLAVSLFDALFPDAPEEKEGGLTLSAEPGLTVEETVSPLYNVLWSWMLDDEGRNVLVEPSGEERFPDFDLYKHIAEHVHGAIPSYQFSKAAFDRFQVNPSEVGDVKKWSLFC